MKKITMKDIKRNWKVIAIVVGTIAAAFTIKKVVKEMQVEMEEEDIEE